jgi:hypothetical protein
MARCKDCDTLRAELSWALEEVASLHTSLAEWNQSAADALRLSDARQTEPGRRTGTRCTAAQRDHNLRRGLAAAAGKPKT